MTFEIRFSANMFLKSYTFVPTFPRRLFTRAAATVAVAMAVAFCSGAAARAGVAVGLVPDKIAPAIGDRQDFLSPDRLHLDGLLGFRIDANTTNRLATMDVTRLLEGYRKRPGRQSWDGEHVGKWLHAATLAWVYSGNPALKEKMDSTVAELMKCQLDDGYLGTYLDKDRWTEWDVWAHKYNLIGLITYMRYTGNLAPLPTCRRMADLLCNTFGDEPGKRDIIKAGYHMGMAPTSVLEPMVLLYRMTGEQRYLDFCKYILRAWEQPNGAKILSTLLDAKRVDKVGNGKAYEMLSCLNGALEYYRVCGDPKILQACVNAWDDIVRHRLYLTGTASYNELFHDDFDMPNVANVGETCVTVTWIQFNAQLLRLTGQARFADQLERAVLNQLFGAQRCDGAAWGYYVQMEGTKPYSGTLDGHCCLSSGPRGVALIPTFATTTDADGVVLNLYEAGVAQLALRDGTPISVQTRTAYPNDGHIAVELSLPMPKVFMVKVRVPAWCPEAVIRVNGKAAPQIPGTDGYVALNRQWKMGDKIEIDLTLEPRIVLGDHKNLRKVAVLYGPLVLAADEAALKAANADVSFNSVGAGGTSIDALKIKPEKAPAPIKTWRGAQVYQINGIARPKTGGAQPGRTMPIDLVPFSEAGQSGSRYKVWLPLTVAPRTDNVLQDGEESRSRHGNILGSIVDADPRSFVVTFDGGSRAEDWFAVTLEEPASIGRVEFAHGNTFHDGGWFDASAGKPRVQVKASKDDSWQTVGELIDYPATTATDSGGLTNGQRFTLIFPAPKRVAAIRVAGKPATGDNAKQAFASCAELQAFEH